MTSQDIKTLESIIARIEVLQNRTKDSAAKDHLGGAKSELLTLLRKV